MNTFLERLTRPEPLVLDGATGTEINRRGVETTLPLWSAGALRTHPALVRDIHIDYLRAGADIITTNTFRTHAHNLGTMEEARRLTRLATELAQQAIEAVGQPAFVAGSVAPLEECYAPELTPSEAYCQREQARIVHDLVESGVDLILIETMNTIYEARAAAEAARAEGVPFIVSFVLDEAGQVLSGETLPAAVESLAPLQPAALMINCIPTRKVEEPLKRLRGLTDRPIGAYGHMGLVDDDVGWTPDENMTPAHYGHQAAIWLALGAQIIGSCCGSTPAHTGALRQLVDRPYQDEHHPPR
jgi:homocysteine S-methyltransferase